MIIPPSVPVLAPLLNSITSLMTVLVVCTDVVVPLTVRFPLIVITCQCKYGPVEGQLLASSSYAHQQQIPVTILLATALFTAVTACSDTPFIVLSSLQRAQKQTDPHVQ